MPQVSGPVRFSDWARNKGLQEKGCLLVKRVAAETLGTYGMVFAGTGAIMIDSLSGGKVTHLGIGITFGLIVAVMIFTFGRISGAHINPAVTLAFTVTRRLRWTVALCYIPAQLAGGILASLTLYYLLGPTASMGATLPSGSVEQSLVLEIILTFILMAVIMSLSLEPRIVGPVAALAIGGTVGLEAIFAGPISGASMNPARSLAPALVGWEWHGHWAYWVGPIIGATLGAVTICWLKGVSITRREGVEEEETVTEEGDGQSATLESSTGETIAE